MLLGLTGHRQVDALFCAVLGESLDHREMERQRIRRHMFLARFGRQSVLQWDDVESRLVRRYADSLAEFLREEGDAVKRAMDKSERD